MGAKCCTLTWNSTLISRWWYHRHNTSKLREAISLPPMRGIKSTWWTVDGTVDGPQYAYHIWADILKTVVSFTNPLQGQNDQEVHTIRPFAASCSRSGWKVIAKFCLHSNQPKTCETMIFVCQIIRGGALTNTAKYGLWTSFSCYNIVSNDGCLWGHVQMRSVVRGRGVTQFLTIGVGGCMIYIL